MVITYRGRRGLIVTILALIAVSALFAAVGVWLATRSTRGLGAVGGFGYAVLMPLFVAALAIANSRKHRHDRTVLSSSGITVRSASEVTTYRWEDMLEVGWVSAEYPTLLSLLYVRIKGTTWAKPGPNLPGEVRMPIYGRRHRLAAREAIRTACERHRVPFWEKGTKMMSLAPPGSPFRRPA